MSLVIEALTGTRDLLHNNLIFGVGALLLAGFFGGKLASRLRLPTISGYIVAGLILGPSILNVVPDHIVESLAPVPHIALGLIAITIGSEFRIAKLRQTGRNILIITTVQLLTTFAAVTLALMLFGAPPPMALLLGAIASATAPAATVAIATELRARGPLVSTLFGVVALDDAFCIALFGFVMAFATAMVGGASELGPAMMILHPMREIAVSVGIGLLFGYIVHRLVVNRRKSNEIIVIVLGFVLLTSGITVSIHVSPLIANMMMGFALVNLSVKNTRVMRVLEPLSPPIYAAFFALAGTELDIRTLATTGVLGVVYLLSRAAGKYGGAYLGAVAASESPATRKYLGMGLLPQAGVAIGLILVLQDTATFMGLPYMGQMVNIVLASILVNEVIGPPLAKYALEASGSTRRATTSGQGVGR
ncbi:MAG: cation:proton antiporter [Candidatus Eisenbacteria bacterium]|nr:cation:proton antiporter [Candidatus Eisenbacteria bacterium]